MANEVKELGLSEQEVKQGYRMVNVKVPPNMDILFVDDAHIVMLTTAAEITANGANVSIAMREHTHKGIENVVKAECRKAEAAWNSILAKLDAELPNMVRADRIAHALQTIGRAAHVKAMSEKATEQLKRIG